MALPPRPPLAPDELLTRSPADAMGGEGIDGVRLQELSRNAAGPFISRAVIRSFARIAEWLLLSALGFLIAHVYVTDLTIWQTPQYAAALAGTALATVLIFDALGTYHVTALSSIKRPSAGLLAGWTAAMGVLVAGVFFLKIGPEYSRVWLALWYLAGAITILSARALFSIQVRRWVRDGSLERRAVIYGGGPDTQQLIEALGEDGDNDLRVCAYFDDRTVPREPKEGAPAHLARKGAISELVEYARRSRVDVVILNLPLTAEDRILQAVNQLSELPVDVRLPAKVSKLRFRPRTYSYIGRVPFIDLSDRPISDWGLITKFLFDKFIALIALILLTPLMLTVAAIVKATSKGPVLFRQKRYGFNNELIEVYKFRSMYVEMTDAKAERLVTRDDPRVTPFGRFIRRTSIDELPQLINVLHGDISLVGPRPHALQAKAGEHLYDDVVEGYFARHKVKPGITGWAQVNGWRGETDTEEKIRKRVEHDLYYIENWSLLFDIYILLRTPFALLKSENAF